MDEQWYVVCTYHSLFIHSFELFLPLKVKVFVAQSCPTLCNHMDRSPPGSSIYNSPGKNTGVGCHFLTPGDLPNPGIEPRSPTLQTHSLVWVTMTPWTIDHQIPLSIDFSRQQHWSGLPFSFSRGSSRLRDWTQVSCVAGRFFIVWATRKMPLECCD